MSTVFEKSAAGAFVQSPAKARNMGLLGNKLQLAWLSQFYDGQLFFSSGTWEFLSDAWNLTSRTSVDGSGNSFWDGKPYLTSHYHEQTAAGVTLGGDARIERITAVQSVSPSLLNVTDRSTFYLSQLYNSNLAGRNWAFTPRSIDFDWYYIDFNPKDNAGHVTVTLEDEYTVGMAFADLQALIATVDIDAMPYSGSGVDTYLCTYPQILNVGTYSPIPGVNIPGQPSQVIGIGQSSLPNAAFEYLFPSGSALNNGYYGPSSIWPLFNVPQTNIGMALSGFQFFSDEKIKGSDNIIRLRQRALPMLCRSRWQISNQSVVIAMADLSTDPRLGHFTGPYGADFPTGYAKPNANWFRTLNPSNGVVAATFGNAQGQHSSSKFQDGQLKLDYTSELKSYFPLIDPSVVNTNIFVGGFNPSDFPLPGE